MGSSTCSKEHAPNSSPGAEGMPGASKSPNHSAALNLSTTITNGTEHLQQGWRSTEQGCSQQEGFFNLVRLGHLRLGLDVR